MGAEQYCVGELVGLTLGLEVVGPFVGSEVGANVLLGVIAALCVGWGVGFFDGDDVGGVERTLAAEAPVVLVLACAKGRETGLLAWSTW